MTIEAMQLFAKKKGSLEKARTLAAKALALAKVFKIETPEDFARSGEMLKMAKDREGLILDVREEVVVPIGRAHRQMSADFKTASDAWKAVWATLNQSRNSYRARLKESEERRRKEVADLQRERAKRDKEQAAKEAAEAEAEGDKALAAELRAEANKPVVLIPVPPVEPPKTEGLQDKKLAKAKVVDLDKLDMKYCRKVPDMSALNGLARTAIARYEGDEAKANEDAPEGVVFFVDIVPASTGG